MSGIYDKWAKPDADGDFDVAWAAIVRALLGKWSTERCALKSGDDRVGDVVFHGFGAKAEAYFTLPSGGTFALDLPNANAKRGGNYRGGFVLYLGADGSINTASAAPIAAGAKTVNVSGVVGDHVKIELWEMEA